MHVFTLHLQACNYTKSITNFPQYSLQMCSTGPHNFLVRALGHIVKRPLDVLCVPGRGLITGSTPTSVESPRTASPAASGSENTSASVLEMEVEEVEYHVISQVPKSDWIEPAPLDVTSIPRNSEVGGRSAMLEAFHQFQHNPQVQVCTGLDAF